MISLTFGEQVKIILGRKGMTIKELAAIIEERTGKNMSRQNLTQRLNRDNFQEQDMRLITEILECSFQLNILEDRESNEDISVGADKGPTARELKKVTKNRQKKAAKIDSVRDVTLGELVDMTVEDEAMVEPAKEEYNVIIEKIKNSSAAVQETPDDQETEEIVIEPGYEIFEEDDIPVDVPASSAQPPKEKKQFSNLLKGYLGKSRQRPPRQIPEADFEEQPEPDELADLLEIKSRENEKQITPPQEETEPKVAAEIKVEEEDLEKGELNPYTGREYQTNSVRIHPARIGYVQVYDRTEHGWTDMTEWAFLGYQERKKAMLGKDYEPPIYLD